MECGREYTQRGQASGGGREVFVCGPCDVTLHRVLFLVFIRGLCKDLEGGGPARDQSWRPQIVLGGHQGQQSTDVLGLHQRSASGKKEGGEFV